MPQVLLSTRGRPRLRASQAGWPCLPKGRIPARNSTTSSRLLESSRHPRFVPAASEAVAEKEHPSSSGQGDDRLRGFPAPLDREIVKMALPSLAAVVMDPLLGIVDTGAKLAAVCRRLRGPHNDGTV